MTRLIDVRFPAGPTLAAATLAAKSPPCWRTRLADWRELVKPRLTLLALFTVAMGFLLASPSGWTALIHTLGGAALVAFAASALNQVWERETDGRMVRTQHRPLPGGRIGVGEALLFGCMCGVGGVIYLALAVNGLAALLGLAILAAYVFVYTPLKRRTPWNTVVGAVPGALPPLLGWSAAGAELGAAAWSLFALLFFWQFPHFWAIAWLYRRDYARAGLKMLPVLDRESGRATGRMMVHHCLLLLLAGLGPAATGLAGPIYAFSAAAIGLVFLGFALRFLVRPGDSRARQVLWASLVYLPLVLTLLAVDRVSPPTAKVFAAAFGGTLGGFGS
jgi:protoheme IX farnesyltransferase